MTQEETVFIPSSGSMEGHLAGLKTLLARMESPYRRGDTVGIKLHWGERGNLRYLSPVFAREIVRWLRDQGVGAFVFDTTVLYSGGRRNGADALQTAAEHDFTEDYLGCPVVIADGLDGRELIDLPAGYRHFQTVQVARVFDRATGFFILSHFKGHLEAGFGGAIKNISMGFASRAQKQRMHSDAKPVLIRGNCTRCGTCVEVCPVQAAHWEDDGYPGYNLEVCIGCAQCIGLCPEVALQIKWDTDQLVFQEKLVETAAAVWRLIWGKTLLVNALLNICTECDCLPGKHPLIAPDAGFIGGYHPVVLDRRSVEIVGAPLLDKAHPGLPWNRQFTYAKELGFL
ncbi:MAG: DUF362 domain-containing protein [Syntrophales bacterium]|jgi:uncharacterized Fe-S center protein|nr:DUF362 domain-containing protein [Syntrophales bacterium]